MPSQCYNYTTISDATRLTTQGYGTACDNSSVFNSVNAGSPTYVRFVSPGGTRLATSPPNSTYGLGYSCGTVASGWTNTTYPSVVGQTVNAFACFAYGTNTCFGSVYYFPIINCNGFYVHGLYAPGACYYRYCTQWVRCTYIWTIGQVDLFFSFILYLFATCSFNPFFSFEAKNKCGNPFIYIRVLCVLQKVKIIDEKLILIKLSKKNSSLRALRNFPLGPADALFLSCRTRWGVSTVTLVYLHKWKVVFLMNYFNEYMVLVI